MSGTHALAAIATFVGVVLFGLPDAVSAATTPAPSPAVVTCPKVVVKAPGKHFTAADLAKIHDLRCADLHGAVFAGLSLDQMTLINANLSGADLTSASLVQADLAGAKLNGATLSNANLGQATLDHADLTGATLINAKLGQVDARNAISSPPRCTA